MSNIVRNWFGEEFNQLHPKIQLLHTNGGELVGNIRLQYGAGIAGIVGKRLGKKLGLPSEAGEHNLRVIIAHDESRMQWIREFSDTKMISSFYPVGNFPDGYWREVTGNLELRLGVSTEGGAWQWLQQKTLVRKIPIPLLFLPKVHAYKKVLNNQYEFSVQVNFKLLGTLVSYGGVLELSESV